MARIAGVDIPREKRVEVALTYIYGIGLTTSQEDSHVTRVDPDTRVKNLTEEEVARLREYIDRSDEIKVEGDLRREVDMNIKRLHGDQQLSRHTPSPQPCRCMASAPEPMHVPAGEPRRQWPARRRRRRSNHRG